MNRLVLLLWAAVTASAQNPLLLDDILNSVEKNYPPLLAAFADRDIADGELKQALGKFDFILAAQYDTEQLGLYPNNRLNTGFEQNFTWWGTQVTGGYRVSEGTVPPYNGGLATLSAGEWRTGVKMPLLRNRQIDDKRAGVQRARIGQTIADLGIDQQRLLVRQMAARRYWDWVSSGQRLRVAQDNLRVAEERDNALREAARLGQIPAIEVTENQRQILQRQAALVEAERGLQFTAIDLSLFYRDSTGEPRLPDNSQLPPRLPETSTITDMQFQEDLRDALRKRPDIARLSAQKEQTRVELRLAENDRKAAVDLGIGYAADAGVQTGLNKVGNQEFKASVRFELPWQRRNATGKLQAAEAKFAQLSLREQYAKNQVEAEVRDAASAVRAAHNRALLATGEVKVAQELADAERERFRLGDSTLFTVNLREQAAVEAEVRSVSAANDYLRALTAYEQVTAKLLN